MVEEYTNRELGLLLKDIGDDIKEIKTAIFGNGKPGLKQDVHDLKTWKKERCEEIEKLIYSSSNTNYFKKIVWGTVRWIGSGTLVALVIKFWDK